MKRQNQQLKHQNLQIKLTKGTDDALPTVLNAGFCNTQYWAMLVPQHVILQQPPLPVALRQWLVVIVCHSYMMLYVYIYIYLQYLRKPAQPTFFPNFPRPSASIAFQYFRWSRLYHDMFFLQKIAPLFGCLSPLHFMVMIVPLYFSFSNILPSSNYYSTECFLEKTQKKEKHGIRVPCYTCFMFRMVSWRRFRLHQHAK